MERKPRKRFWSASEIKALLDVWELHSSELRRAKRNARGPTVNNMHLEMKEVGVDISIEEIKNKMKNMTQRFRMERNKAKESPSKWMYFERLSKFLGAFPRQHDTSIEDGILDDSNTSCTDAVVFTPDIFTEKVKAERVDLQLSSPCSSPYSSDAQDSYMPESIECTPAINPGDIIGRLLFNLNRVRSEQGKTSDITDDAVRSDSRNASKSKRELTEIHEDILAELANFNANESKRLKLQNDYNERSLQLLAERNEWERKRNDISERYLKHFQESNNILKRIMKRKRL